MPAQATLYAVAYRPVVRLEQAEIDIWPATLAVGDPLPELPLRLTGDLFVPVDFEATYQEACRRHGWHDRPGRCSLPRGSDFRLGSEATGTG